MYGELYIEPEWAGINPRNGQFLPGHVPANKGKKWSDYMGKRAQKRAAKGWKNLDIYRYAPRDRSKAGRNRKPVICINLEGKWTQYPYIGRAAECLGIKSESIGRCCRDNSKQRVNRKTGKVNTDHQYMGLRFYYETDSHIWGEKINRSCKLTAHARFVKHNY